MTEQSYKKNNEMMSKEAIFDLLEKEGLQPEYIEIDDVGFSRCIRFKTKYQECWIKWWANLAVLEVGDRYSIRIPFTGVGLHTTSPSNKKSLLFTNNQVTKNFGLADYETELTLEKLDWQSKSPL